MATERSQLAEDPSLVLSPLTSGSISYELLSRQPESFYKQHGKRLVDLALGVPMFLVALPIIVLMAWLVVLTSGRPAFYIAKRIGKDGKEFSMWKLRTMRHDAELVLARWKRDNPELAREYEENFKLRDDPRITRIGRILRRTSLDELPQLWNVIKGDMSLVGPRPIVREELKHYGENVPLLLSTRPGITGRWQVQGRNDISYPERAWLELESCVEVSLTSDVTILIRTAGAMARVTGL